jgi:hypothetical protein
MQACSPTRSVRLTAVVLTALLGAASFDAPAEARYYGSGRVIGEVTVCSRYGGRCISGLVRDGRKQREVRMPGGTWIGCKKSCHRTLREEALDFFETLNERVTDN